MNPRRVPPASASPAAVLVLATLLALATPGQAAGQPEAPGEFRNGQDNGFGSIAMAPYLSAGDGSMPIEAHIVLRDLEAVEAAADVLFAFNVKGDAVRATVGSLRTADGKALAPLRTVTVDEGRQPQAHFAPADLLAVARDGRLDLVLEGRVEARADTQAHVGAMVIAFDEGWSALQSGAGPAQLYGFTMVSAVGVGGGMMPFQGQGNTLAVLPLVLAALFVAMAGATAVAMLARMPPAAAAAVRAPGGTTSLLAFGQPSRPATLGGPAPRRAAPASALPGSSPVPVFGGPASPTRQGPRLPPHPLDRSPMIGAANAAGPAAPAPTAASAQVPVFGGPASPILASSSAGPATARPVQASRPPPPPGSLVPAPMQGPLLPPHPLDRSPMFGSAPPRRPGQRPVARAGGAARTATKRPKARPSGNAAASRAGEPSRERVSQASR